MFIFDISNILNLVLMLIGTILLVFLAQELKKSYITGIVLFAYLILLVFHVGQMVTLPQEYQELLPTLVRCVAIDFVFVLISFFSYLWVDDIEAKKMKKTSLDKSLDWLWKNV